MMNNDDYRLSNEWHYAINEFSMHTKPWPSWMYAAKDAFGEIKRLPLLFAMERTGTLPAIHHQCSHDAEGQPVEDNHLTCAMGVECRKCPFLLALDAIKAAPEEIDQMKAWTCVTHILTEKHTDMFDTSEGFILTTDDKIYWSNVYSSLADMSDDDPDIDDDDPDEAHR